MERYLSSGKNKPGKGGNRATTLKRTSTKDGELVVEVEVEEEEGNTVSVVLVFLSPLVVSLICVICVICG